MALKRFSCYPECGFIVQDQNEDELTKFAIVHTKITHKTNISEDEIRSMTKNVLEY